MKLTRYAYLEDRTLGRLEHDGEIYWTVERPWLDNQPNVSCIPEGVYRLGRHKSGRFNNPDIYIGDSWEIKDVPGRTYILLHVGNRSSDVVGCVALGNTVYPNLEGVGDSRNATTRLYEQTRGETTLIIEITSGALR